MSAVHIGQTVVREPVSLSKEGGKKPQRMRGSVVWIHPEGRFHVVSFPTNGGPVMESFVGVNVNADPDYRG